MNSLIHTKVMSCVRKVKMVLLGLMNKIEIMKQIPVVTKL